MKHEKVKLYDVARKLLSELERYRSVNPPKTDIDKVLVVLVDMIELGREIQSKDY